MPEQPEQVQQIEVELVDPSPYQPRRRFSEEKLDELAASIRYHGVVQPIVVRPKGPRFELIAGERRLRAARRVGLARIPAIVRRYTEEQALETALIENLQREDITPVEAARAYDRLAREYGYTQSEIAQRTGKSRAAVNNTLRLLQLPDAVLALLDEGELTEGHARALLALPYASLRIEVAEWIVRNGVPVREVELKVRKLVAEPEGRAPRPAARRDAHLAELEERLRRHFSTRAGISYRAGAGTVSLEFYSDDDLWRILEIMGLDGE